MAATPIRDFNSSIIARAAYDPDTQVLTVWLRTREEPYRYHHVPAHVFARLLSVESPGRYYNEHIRDVYSLHP